MEASLWVSKTGLDAQQMRMNVISNNLANVNTVGFKKDRAVFEDLLYQNIRQAGGSTGGDNISPTGLMIGTGVRIVSTEKNYNQGSMIQTKNARWTLRFRARVCSRYCSPMERWRIPVTVRLSYLLIASW